MKTSQPVTWCSFRSLPPPIMWIQRPSRSQSCLSQSGYNDLWQCIYSIFQYAINDTSSSSCMRMFEVKDIHFYRFISEAQQSRSFAWSCMKRHALKNREPENDAFTVYLCNSYRCIQLGGSCWPLALNNYLEPVPYNM